MEADSINIKGVGTIFLFPCFDFIHGLEDFNNTFAYLHLDELIFNFLV